MRTQNDELQEELLSAERALRFFRNEVRPSEVPVPSTPLSEGSGYIGMKTPPGPTAPTEPQVPDPKPYSIDLRGTMPLETPISSF